MEQQAAPATPWHLWIVAILSLIWNAGGGYDFVMTNIRDVDYLDAVGVGAGVMQAIDAMPVWAMVAWAVGVWGAVAGSLLLLMRSRFALHAFAASLVGLAGSTAYQLGADLPDEMTTPGVIAMTLAIWAAAVLLFVYARRMEMRGVLR